MVAPLTPFTIRGAIWYQGEANSTPDRAPYYDAVFRALIDDWRKQWGEGDFPFLFVQLPNFDLGSSGWAVVRDAQRKTLNRAHTAMVVSLDVGERLNIHPPNKKTVGERLALAASATVYGEAIEYSGPLYRQMTREGGSCRIWFDHSQGLRPSAGELKGFEVAGADGVFVSAKAEIDHDSVVVSADSVKAPVSVRYGGASFSEANLVNSDGLPAAAFISQ
jgi:sialate O-acetylesterase